MEDGVNGLTSIESRHKKEKKELQSQIQALKKAAKNDKSKKKELTTEIVRLEFELDDRHKRENETAKNDNSVTSTEEVVEVEENNLSKSKVSKAQKRRDKKLQQDRDRDEEIKLQEKENLCGPRNLEIQSIMDKLTEKHLNIYPIPSDGDCLYKAVSHQLVVTRQQVQSVDELRKNVANYIKSHKNDFIPFMSNPNTCEMLTENEFEDYCNKIHYTKVWGGQLEIRALSSSLKCPINVIQATGPDTIEQGNEFEGPPLIITYHRHMYSLGEHYNSTSQSRE